MNTDPKERNRLRKSTDTSRRTALNFTGLLIFDKLYKSQEINNRNEALKEMLSKFWALNADPIAYL